MVAQENDVITKRVSWSLCLSFLSGEKLSGLGLQFRMRWDTEP